MITITLDLHIIGPWDGKIVLSYLLMSLGAIEPSNILRMVSLIDFIISPFDILQYTTLTLYKSMFIFILTYVYEKSYIVCNLKIYDNMTLCVLRGESL